MLYDPMVDGGASSGGYRQSHSGALVFPPSPEYRKARETRKELEKELEETRALKEELKELMAQMKNKM